MHQLFDIQAIRQRFPALAIKDGAIKDGTAPRLYFDNPAGTQVPQDVIDRTVDTLIANNANLGGYFRTSIGADAIVAEAHQAVADMYGAASPDEIIFGQNMTTLTFHMSRCLAKSFQPGDEIVLSRMDHDANVAPWLLMAQDKGMTVRWMEFDPETFEFPDDALTKVLTSKTKIVALGYASNCTGTINGVQKFCAEARAAGALTYVDAVQFAPHGLIDVDAIGCDFLVSSAYKWFGPHMAALWGRRELLDKAFAYKVRPAGDSGSHRFETGTLSHEGMAGCLGAIDYLASIGTGNTRREKLTSAWTHMETYERQLSNALIAGLLEIKNLKIRGITSANAAHRRVPTVSFTVENQQPSEMARKLADANIFVWSGHNYAIEPIAAMGLTDKGGVLRVGLAHYNTLDEISHFADTLQQIV